ncbi:MAG: VOC family protein [Planctomycetota bacterium]
MATKTKKTTKPAKKAPANKAAKKAPANKAAAKKAEKSEKKDGGFKPVHGALCHIEFSVSSLETASKFYSELLGWEFHPFQPTEMYFALPGGQMGGCILQGTPSNGGALFYATVMDIPATIEKAEKLGGSVTQGKTTIHGDHGYYAKLQSPDGSHFAIWSMT